LVFGEVWCAAQWARLCWCVVVLVFVFFAENIFQFIFVLLTIIMVKRVVLS